MAKNPQWRDVTSYSQREESPLIPRTWELMVNGELRITITRRFGEPPDAWFVSVRPDLFGVMKLDSKHEVMAKTEAIRHVKDWVQVSLTALNKMVFG